MVIKYYVQYNEVHSMIETQSKKIKEKCSFDYIICINGGGAIPSRIMRSYLDDIKILTINVKLYDSIDKTKPEIEWVQFLDSKCKKFIKGKNIQINSHRNEV